MQQGVDGAWCSHCPGWLTLPRAISHRIGEHQDCLSCQAEVLALQAIRRGLAEHIDYPPRGRESPSA